MIPLPSDISSKDVHQWLEGGWFYVENKGKHEIGHLGASHPSDPLYEVRLLGGQSLGYVPFNRMFSYWPQCGALNILPDKESELGKFAISLIRLQKKQWKRTYNGYCLKLRPISNKPDHFQINADCASVVRAAFNPEYYTYTEALKFKFPDGWVSVAINPNLIVMKVPDEQMVFIDGEIVGTINDSTRVFTCVNPGLKRRLLPHLDYMVE